MDKSNKELPLKLQTLIDEIGYDNALKVAKLFGGSYQYIPKPDKLIKLERNDRIREEFNGYNLEALAKKYNLSVIQVRNICKDDLEAKKKKPLEGQLSLF